MKVRLVDLPDLHETFADSVNTVVWDGQTLRVELSVTRFQSQGTGGATEATRYPACRLVLSAAAATDLFNRLQQTTTAIKDAAAAQAKAQPGAADQAPAADKPAAKRN